MKRCWFLGIVIFCLFVVLEDAYAFWIWTPQTRRWVNPKTQPKDNPQAQLDYALSFYTDKKYNQARQELLKLLKVYPRAKEAAEAQYYLGRIAEEEGDLYAAYQHYQKVVDKYPFSERIQEIIEREFKLAEAFMTGYKRKALGVELPVENPAIEIFNKVIENSTYGPLAPAAQYKLGLVLKSMGRFYEAEEAFNKVITNYPTSEWVEPAKFQIATCRAALARNPDYDQGATAEAKQRFEQFLKEHPDAELSQEAEKNINELKEKEAEANFNIGKLYEKRRLYKAAQIYYRYVIENYPRSKWAPLAFERLQIVERKLRQ